MASVTPSFVCQNCGAVYNRWKGNCEACGGWNSIVEETGSASPMPGAGRHAPVARQGPDLPARRPAGETKEAPRTPSGIAELDRVTGGGFVRGSVILLGGDPGIGKSTLLMQACAALARAAASASSTSPAKRRSARSGCAPSGLASARRRSNSPRRPTSRTSSRRCRQGRPPALVDHRLDPDHVDRNRGIGARHGDPGARLRAGADPLRQDERHRGDPRRPRHQGRPDRRPPRRRAHGRCGGVVRGR